MRTIKARPAQARRPVCTECGGATGAKLQHGDLHCSELCRKRAATFNQANHRLLIAEGFEQDKETPNIYRKDGVATTLEHVRYVGFQKALQHHAQAVAATAKRA
jgi:hypothetical protein